MKSIPDRWYDRFEPYHKLVNKLIPDDATILVIGANDGIQFDPTFRVWRSTWKGIYIEPDPRAMKLLQQNITNSNAQFIQTAIGSVDGKIELHTMTDEAATKFHKEKNTHGSAVNSFNRKHVERHVLVTKKQNRKMMMSKIQVSCRRLSSLLQERGIKRVDVIQEDTEGMDGIIMNEVLECLKMGLIQPKIILFEHQHIGTDEAENTIKAFKEHPFGFQCVRLRNDTVLYKEGME